jgi:hypothetical protein
MPKGGTTPKQEHDRVNRRRNFLDIGTETLRDQADEECSAYRSEVQCRRGKIFGRNTMTPITDSKGGDNSASSPGLARETTSSDSQSQASDPEQAPNFAQEMARIPQEPLLGVEKKLIVGSLLLGLVLLLVLYGMSQIFFPAPATRP